MSEPTETEVRDVWVCRDPKGYFVGDVYVFDVEPVWQHGYWCPEGDGWETVESFIIRDNDPRLDQSDACLARYGVIPEPRECVRVQMRTTSEVLDRKTAKETDQ